MRVANDAVSLIEYTPWYVAMEYPIDKLSSSTCRRMLISTSGGESVESRKCLATNKAVAMAS